MVEAQTRFGQLFKDCLCGLRIRLACDGFGRDGVLLAEGRKKCHFDGKRLADAIVTCAGNRRTLWECHDGVFIGNPPLELHRIV